MALWTSTFLGGGWTALDGVVVLDSGLQHCSGGDEVLWQRQYNPARALCCSMAGGEDGCSTLRMKILLIFGLSQ
jgi:hypothetical protein